MILPSGPVRVYVATKPVDFRKGIDGLALAVQEMLGIPHLFRKSLLLHPSIVQSKAGLQ